MRAIFEIARKAWGLIMTGEEQRYISGIVEKVQDTLMETNRELRQLTAEFREHRGEFKEFKQHVMGRVEKLEKNEGERGGKIKSTIGVVLSAIAIGITIIINFFIHGGK